MSAPVFHDTGEGPALLMLHAFPVDASQWDAQVAALSGRYRCLRPDFWGCGVSPPPPGPVSMDGYAATLLDELDRRGVDTFSVCGGSMGGYMVFALLRAARQRVRAIVLANTRATADDDTVLASRGAMAEQVRADGVEAIVEPMTQRLLCARCRDDPHIADPVRGRIRRCSTEGALAAIEAVATRPDSSAMLHDIAVPTLVVCGSADVIISLDVARAMAAAMPRAALCEFEGGAHLVNLEQPQAFSAAVGEFLDSSL